MSKKNKSFKVHQHHMDYINKNMPCKKCLVRSMCVNRFEEHVIATAGMFEGDMFSVIDYLSDSCQPLKDFLKYPKEKLDIMSLRAWESIVYNEVAKVFDIHPTEE